MPAWAMCPADKDSAGDSRQGRVMAMAAFNRFARTVTAASLSSSSAAPVNAGVE
jgi:hypothetical protein